MCLCFNLKKQGNQSIKEGFGDNTKYYALTLESSKWKIFFDIKGGQANILHP